MICVCVYMDMEWKVLSPFSLLSFCETIYISAMHRAQTSVWTQRLSLFNRLIKRLLTLLHTNRIEKTVRMRRTLFYFIKVISGHWLNLLCEFFCIVHCHFPIVPHAKKQHLTLINGRIVGGSKELPLKFESWEEIVKVRRVQQRYSIYLYDLENRVY